MGIKDLIPSHLKLSEIEQEHLTNLMSHLYDTEQTNLISFLSQSLQTSPPPLLQQGSIESLAQKSIHQNIKNAIFLKLSYIESTAKESLDAAESEKELFFDTPANRERNDLLVGVIRSCQELLSSTSPTSAVYHGWITMSSNKQT